MTNGIQLAILLSVLSAVSYAAAAVVQEQLAAAGHRSVPRWLVTLVRTGAGAGLHVIALGYGTVGVVQALGALTLLFAADRRHMNRRQLGHASIKTTSIFDLDRRFGVAPNHEHQMQFLIPGRV